METIRPTPGQLQAASPSRLVLLIEENEELRDVYRGGLEGMDLSVAATPRAGKMPHLFEVADMADLLVTDVGEPDSETIALTEYLLSRHLGLGAVLIATEKTEPEVRRRFRHERARFLLKPFSIDQFRQVVEDALAFDRPAAGAGGHGFQPLAVPGPTRSRIAASGLVAAAAIVLAAGFLFRSPGPAAPPLPEAVPSAVMRGSMLKVSEPMGDLREMPRRLRWQEIVDAASYRLRILAVDDTVLWEGVSAAGSVALEPKVVKTLNPGVVYFWTVEALDADGEVMLRSEPARFQVVPPRS